MKKFAALVVAATLMGGGIGAGATYLSVREATPVPLSPLETVQAFFLAVEEWNFGEACELLDYEEFDQATCSAGLGSSAAFGILPPVVVPDQNATWIAHRPHLFASYPGGALDITLVRIDGQWRIRSFN